MSLDGGARRAAVLVLIFLLSPAAAAAEWSSRYSLGARVEQTNGLSEFFAPFRRKNPFDGSQGNPRILDTEGYRALQALYEPYATPDLDDRRFYSFLDATGMYRWESGWSIEGKLASRELSSSAIENDSVSARARNYLFVDELLARYARWDDWKSYGAGRMLVTSGRGFLHDDYQLSAYASADLELAGYAPLALRAQASKIEGEHLDETGAETWDAEGLFDSDESAFFAEGSIGYPISLLESVGVSYARFQERDNYFADLMNPIFGESIIYYSSMQATGYLRASAKAITERYARCRKQGRSESRCMNEAVDAADYAMQEQYERQLPYVVAADQGVIGSSRSFLNYLMLNGDHLAGPLGVSWLAIGQWGRFTLTDFPAILRDEEVQKGDLIFPERLDIPARGLLLYGSVDYSPVKPITLRAHYLFSSGDNRKGAEFQKEETYDSFLGVRPYVRLTNIFFAGGISENLRSGSLSPSGYHGHGVWAPVLDVEWTPTKKWTVVTKAAYLHAQRTPSTFGAEERGGEYGYEGDLTVYFEPREWLRLSAEGDVFKPGDFFVNMPTVWKAGAGIDFLLDVPKRGALH